MSFGVVLLLHGCDPFNLPSRRLMRDRENGQPLAFPTRELAQDIVRCLNSVPHRSFEVVRLDEQGRPLPRWGLWRVLTGPEILPKCSWVVDQDGAPIAFYSFDEAAAEGHQRGDAPQPYGSASYIAKQLPPED
jgi:hypothetical protein